MAVSTQRGDARSSAHAGAFSAALRVDRAAEIPIGVQLAWALRTRIRDGQLTPGQRLPGLREIAHATGVNVNTVRAVYQRLEQEGLIDSQQGSGTFVASVPPRSSVAASIAADAAREAHETGVDPREVAAALYAAPALAPHAGNDTAARRRLLREQIAALERTLGELEAKHPRLAPPAAPAHAQLGPALLGVAALEDIRTQLVRRLSVVQTAIDALAGDARAATRASGRTRTARPKPAPARGRAAKTAPASPRKPKAPAPKPAARPRAGGAPAPAGA